MRKYSWSWRKILFGVLSLSLLATLSLTSVVAGQSELAQNSAYVECRHFYQHTTDGDYVSNSPQPFGSWWGVYLLNWPDETQEPLVNPNVTLITSSSFSGVWGGLPWGYYGPLESNVTGPPTYMWYWNRNLREGMEPADAIDIHAFESTSSVFAPGLSFGREVYPSIIRGPRTTQVTIASLRIEQPLPENVNSISVAIATWRGSQHVATEFVAASPRPSVAFRTQDIQWHIPANLLQIGKTYEFKAVFRIYKLVDQKVFFKPHVGVSVGYRLGSEPTIGDSVTVNHPDGATAIVSAENDAAWGVTIAGGYSVTLSRISELVPD